MKLSEYLKRLKKKTETTTIVNKITVVEYCSLRAALESFLLLLGLLLEPFETFPLGVLEDCVFSSVLICSAQQLFSLCACVSEPLSLEFCVHRFLNAFFWLAQLQGKHTHTRTLCIIWMGLSLSSPDSLSEWRAREKSSGPFSRQGTFLFGWNGQLWNGQTLPLKWPWAIWPSN